MAADISSWQKTKDSLLIGFCSIIVVLILRVQTSQEELKVQLAVYQANQAALRADHERLAAAVEEHFREDRERFNHIQKGEKQ